MDFDHKVTKSRMINPLTDGNEHLRTQEEEITRDFHPAEEIVTSTRYVEIGKKKWTIQRKDPHGFWNIIPPAKMSLPERLSGRYTNANDCKRAIDTFVNLEILEPAGKLPETSRVRRQRTELPAVETVEALS